MDDLFNPWSVKLRNCSAAIDDLKEALKDGSIDLGHKYQAFSAWLLACECLDYLNFFMEKTKLLNNEGERSAE